MPNAASISTGILCPSGQAPLSLAAGLPLLAEAGFQFIEFSRRSGDPEHSGAIIADCGLRVWSVHGTLGFGAISTDEVERRATVEGEIGRLEGAAEFAPCPYVIHYLDRTHDRRKGEAYRRSVAELLGRAETLAITLAVETAPDKAANERYPDSREIAEFVRSFGSPHLSVCIDLNHSNLAENLVDVAANCAGLISTIHVSDNHGQYEDHLPPGQGMIDFPSAFAALRAAGYAGPVNLECHADGQPTVADLTSLRVWAQGMMADGYPARREPS